MIQGKYGEYKIGYHDDYKKYMTVAEYEATKMYQRNAEEYGLDAVSIDSLLDILVGNYKVLSLNLKWTWDRTGQETYFGNELDIGVDIILIDEFVEVRQISCTFGDICHISDHEDWKRCGYHQVYKFEK